MNKTGQELRLASDALDWLFNMPSAPTDNKKIVFTGRHGGFTLLVVQSQRGLEVTKVKVPVYSAPKINLWDNRIYPLNL